jgi:hypothetical protein
MRGKTQAKLISADDGCAYVVKFADNPHGGRRALVNELIGSVLLSCLGIATPTPAFVEVGDHCVSDGDLLPSGTHFGSRCPGDAVAVYDFLPSPLLHRVSNRGHFVGALMFDLWTANAGRRQAIFFRDPVRPATSAPGNQGFIAEMIGHSSLFGGNDWDFGESVGALYDRPKIYGPDLSIADFHPWLRALARLRPEALYEAVAAIPAEWVCGDQGASEDLVQRLLARRTLVPGMVQSAADVLRAGLNSPRIEYLASEPYRLNMYRMGKAE